MSKTQGTIAVTAKERGYFGGKVREPGEGFHIASEDQFSKAWMTRGGNTAAPVQPDADPEPDAAPKKLSAKERIAAAKELTGRTDIATAKEADAILAAAGQSGEPAPAPVQPDADPEPDADAEPVQADD